MRYAHRVRLLALALLLVAGSEVSAAELPALAEGSWELRLIEREAFVQFLRDCTGYESLRLQGLSARIRVQPGGEGFDLRESLRFSVVVQGQFVQAVGAARLRATRVADGGFVPALRSREGDGRSVPERAIDAIVGDR